MLNLDRLLVRRALDDWSDEQTLIAARVLNQTAGDLIAALRADLKSATLRDTLIANGAYLGRHVTSQARAVAEPIAARLADEAYRALADIVDHQGLWTYGPDPDVAPTSVLEGWTDVASGVAPIAAGGAVAAALPSFAVSTTGGLLGTGLLATTVVSWPVVMIGGTVAAGLVATGLLNSTKLRDRTEARLHRKVTDQVTTMLLRGNAKQPSVLEQLAANYADTAEKARRFW